MGQGVPGSPAAKPQPPHRTDALHLLLAAWGQQDEAGKREAWRFVGRAFEEEASQGGVSVSLEEHPLLALAFWKQGERSGAVSLLNIVLGGLDVDPRGSIFSYWRCRNVPQELFDSDIYVQLHMVRAGRVESPVLGPL